MSGAAEQTGTAGPIQKASLSRLIQFLMRLSREKAYAHVRVVMQRGRIEFIHVDQTYRMDELPSDQRPEGS